MEIKSELLMSIFYYKISNKVPLPLQGEKC